ncbi:MAG: FxDxF family PEP-CTERM protein [Betaproteobacteria bacterium]
MALAGPARADLVSVLQDTPIAASTAVAFHDGNVTPGTLAGNGAWNFLDQWKFSLSGAFDVSSLTAAIAFTDASGQAVLFGVTNLQVNLVGDPPGQTALVSWQAISAPLTGLQQSVALIPTVALGAGDYILQVRGNVTQPGAYSGSLIAQPLLVVPIPATASLFAAGFAALGLMAHRQRRR